jgi:hypothetical protein
MLMGNGRVVMMIVQPSHALQRVFLWYLQRQDTRAVHRLSFAAVLL